VWLWGVPSSRRIYFHALYWRLPNALGACSKASFHAVALTIWQHELGFASFILVNPEFLRNPDEF